MSAILDRVEATLRLLADAAVPDTASRPSAHDAAVVKHVDLTLSTRVERETTGMNPRWRCVVEAWAGSGYVTAQIDLGNASDPPPQVPVASERLAALDQAARQALRVLRSATEARRREESALLARIDAALGEAP